MYKIEEKPELGELATFVPNKHLPVYNWFYYKEGFSRDLVFKLIKDFGMKGPVLDPFAGSGTTLLACKELGIDSTGIETLPIAVFATAAKIADYDLARLKAAQAEIRAAKFSRQNVKQEPDHIRRFFSPYTLEDVLFFRNIVLGMENDVRDFFLLALVNSAIKTSYAYKDGSVIKFVKKPVPPFRKFFFRQAHRMIKDLEKIHFGKCRTTINEGDSRMMKLPDETMNSVITSPPYLNKIEYTNIYRIEDFLLFGQQEPRTGIRSYIGLDSVAKENPLPDENLPEIAVAYFSDMKKVLEQIYRVCKNDAKVAIVVGNCCFPDRVVESDLLLAKIAEEIGFEAKNIYCLSKRWCTTQRTIKVGVLRESLLILEKQI